LEQSIATKGNEIRLLKENGIKKEDLSPHVAQLLDLKSQLAGLDDSSNSNQNQSNINNKGSTQKEQEQSLNKEEPSINELRASRLAKVSAMRDAGVQPYAYRYECTHTAAELMALYEEKLAEGEEDAENSIAFSQKGANGGGDVSVAGRIMARRVFGKLAFYALQDETGVIQLQFDKKRLGERDGESFKVSVLGLCFVFSDEKRERESTGRFVSLLIESFAFMTWK
jgi:hypothetical protein